MAAKRLLTVEQLERLPEKECVSYELHEGELVEVPSASYIHNRNRDGLTHRLLSHLETHQDQGSVIAEQWFRIADDTVFAPDIALIGPAQVPLLEPERRTQPFSPVLAIEITSPSNTFDEIANKMRRYLEAGTRAVWILITPLREVHVYAAGARPRILAEDDLLEDQTLLAGFSVWVRDLFGN